MEEGSRRILVTACLCPPQHLSRGDFTTERANNLLIPHIWYLTLKQWEIFPFSTTQCFICYLGVIFWSSFNLHVFPEISLNMLNSVGNPVDSLVDIEGLEESNPVKKLEFDMPESPTAGKETGMIQEEMFYFSFIFNLVCHNFYQPGKTWEGAFQLLNFCHLWWYKQEIAFEINFPFYFILMYLSFDVLPYA